MKYLYKAMESLGDANGNVILGWHEKVSLARLSQSVVMTGMLIAPSALLITVDGSGWYRLYRSSDDRSSEGLIASAVPPLFSWL